MKNEFNLIKRFLADTPPFWKIIGLIGLVLIGLADLLFQNNLCSGEVVAIVATVGATMKALSLFAQKDIAMLDAATGTVDAIEKLTPVITDQVSEIRKDISPLFNGTTKAR